MSYTHLSKVSVASNFFRLAPKFRWDDSRAKAPFSKDIKSIDPLWSLIILLTIDKPNPVPLAFVVKYGFKISLILLTKYVTK